MSARSAATFAEVAEVMDMLPSAVAVIRRSRGLSLRAAADQIGCSFNTLYRIEQGRDFNAHHLPALLRWLDGRAIAEEER